MREIGPIVRLQIQRAALKTGDRSNRQYSPAPILSVQRLWVTEDGVLGAGPDGAWLVDVHHRDHPAGKNDDGNHGVSIGFTGHYQRMAERFGTRLSLGCAGENVIAESSGVLTFDDVRRGMTIVGADGAPRLALRVLQVATPCRPFTGWALGRRVEPDALKEHLAFLDGGMRGYYCRAEGTGEVCVGDRLVAL